MMFTLGKKRNLVMFTKTYPYGKGEAFIGQEIEIASQFYERIIIYCCQVLDFKEVPRKVPQNVTVIAIKAKSKMEIFWKSIGILLSNERRQCLLNELKRNRGLKKYLFATYFYAKTLAIYDECKECFKYYIDEKSLYTFYSYWFFDIAYVAILMQEQFSLKERSKIITRAHGYDLYEERNPIGYFPFREQMLDKMDAVYACSIQGREYLRQRYPENCSKIKTSYLGTMNKEECEDKHRTDYFHIVTCSYIVPVKRVKKVAEACKILEKRLNNIKWTCFGDGSLKEELVKYCNSNFTTTKVEFKGFCSNQEVLDFYNREYIDLFVNVSSSEGLPVSIMEAMSYGIPCIATDVGGTSEIVEDCETGFLLKEDFEIRQLSDKLYNFFTMPEAEQKSMRVRCKERWRKNFEAESTYIEFYKKINRES